MSIKGKVWKSRKDDFYLAEIPLLDLMVQATSKEEIPSMVKDALELLFGDHTHIHVILSGRNVFVNSDDTKKLIALVLKRQRQKRHLKIDEVASLLKAKSINEYAQYEQGKHLPSMEKFEQLLNAIDPALKPFISIK